MQLVNVIRTVFGAPFHTKNIDGIQVNLQNDAWGDELQSTIVTLLAATRPALEMSMFEDVESWVPLRKLLQSDVHRQLPSSFKWFEV